MSEAEERAWRLAKKYVKQLPIAYEEKLKILEELAREHGRELRDEDKLEVA
ncbi:MAG: hypothetical protein QW734_06455 [Candidatus Bathyarchaeia archaeon]